MSSAQLILYQKMSLCVLMPLFTKGQHNQSSQGEGEIR